MFKRNILKSLALLSAFLITPSVFAADTTGFKMVSQEGDAVNFSWNENEKSPYAQIFYGDNSSNNGTYANDTDLIQGNTHKISGLVGNKTYYFSLKLLNSEGQEINASDELKIKIGDSGKSAGFKLEKIEQVEKNQIKLLFSNDLLETQKTEDLKFKIEDIDNPSNYLDIKDSLIEKSTPKELLLTLDKDIQNSINYKVIALSILDKNGNNIEFGIDSEASFVGQEELNSALPIEKEEKEEELNSAGPIEKEEPSKSGVSGKDMDKEDVKKDLTGVANDKEKLPKTGPEHFILLFIALVIGAFVFIPKYRK